MMRTRHQHLTRGLAGCLAGLGLITAIPTLLWQLSHSSSTVSFSATVSQAVGLVTLGSVGLLLTLRRPANSIGWIFVSVWAYAGGYGLLTAYASAWTLSDPTAADASLATWVVNWAWVPIIGVIAFYPLLLFPTGGPPSPRWRPLVPGAAVLIALWTMAFAFQSSHYSDALGGQVATGNPMASPWLPNVVNAMPVTLAFAFVAVVITAIVSLVQRFRHGDSVTRAQLKWFVLGALCWLPVLLYPGDHGNGGVIDVLLGLALAAVPLAMAMAILRYRLYDIDRIISRTASYTVVTVTVLAVYAVIVTAATRFLPSSNTLAVAGATLAAAALVRPLLHRVQELVDRRFNRSHYDAEHTVDAFAHTIAHTVDSSDVHAALDAAVTTSLQPTRYTVWTRPA